MSGGPLEPAAPLLMIEVNPFWQIKLYPVNCPHGPWDTLTGNRLPPRTIQEQCHDYGS